MCGGGASWLGSSSKYITYIPSSWVRRLYTYGQATYPPGRRPLETRCTWNADGGSWGFKQLTLHFIIGSSSPHCFKGQSAALHSRLQPKNRCGQRDAYSHGILAPFTARDRLHRFKANPTAYRCALCTEGSCDLWAVSPLHAVDNRQSNVA